MTTVEHNQAITRNWFAERKIRHTIPPVREQVETVPFRPESLLPYGYNPSIIRFEKRILMAYRFHAGKTQSALAMAEFDPAFNFIANKQIVINGVNFSEDPKLFIHGKKLCLSWVSVAASTYGVASVVQHGELIEGTAWNAPAWTVENVQQPSYGKNDWSAMEKNWVPFSYQGKIHFIYAHGEVFTTQDSVWKTSVPSGWRYGPIKGGTGPLPYRGKWLRFAHSTLDNEPAPWKRRYYILAMVMESEPPFTVLQISSEPIIRGAETGRVNHGDCSHFKGNVVFTSGAIPYQDGVLLALGVNDAESVLAKLSEKDLKL